MAKNNTNRGDIDRQIRDERQRLYGVLMQAPAMIAVLRGRELLFELANPLYLKVVGKTDTIIGKPLLEVMPELKDQEILKIIRRVYRTGEPFVGNEMLVQLDLDNDGKPKDMYFNFVYQPLKDADGKTDGIMTHAVDVTGQVLNRNVVAESEERYRGLFNSIDEGFCLLEMVFDKHDKPVDYLFLEWNKVFEKQTGFVPVPGKIATELVPGLEKHWIERYGKVARTGKPARFVDGSEALGRWFDAHASRVGGSDSRKVAVLFTDITERRAAEQRQKLTSEQIIDVVESMGDAFFMLDNEWNITRVNGVQEKVSRIKRKDSIGRNFWKVFPGTDAPTSKYWTEYNKVMKTRKPVHFLEYYAPFDIYTETDAYPSLDGGISVFFRDVTERIVSQKALQASELRFRTMADNIPNLAWMADSEGYIFWYNSRWYTYTGTTPEDMEGWGWQAVHDPEVLPDVMKKWQASIDSGEPFGMTFPLRGADGSFRPFLTRVEPVRDEKGKISHWFGTNTDISEQQEMAQALRDSENRFRTLIEQSADVIQLVTAEGKVLYSSDSIKRVLGYNPKDILGVVVAPYIHPEDQEHFKEKWVEVMKSSGNQLSLEYRVKHANGDWVWLETTITNHMETPAIHAVVGNFRLITERKEAEEAIRYQQSLLEAQQEVSPLGMLVVSEAGKMVSYNKRFGEMWRFSDGVMNSNLDEMALQAAQEQLIDPDAFIERVKYLYSAQLASNEMLYFKDGRIFERFGSPVVGRDGEAYGYVWYFLDRTAAKRAEDALKASEAQLRFMAESMPQKVFTAEPDGTVDYYNPQWTEYTGLTVEHLQADGWTDFIHPDELSNNLRLWQESIITGTPFEIEHRFRGKDGKYHWHITRAHAMRNADGKITKWMGSSTDVEAVKRTLTRKKQLEQTTAHLREQRAQLIALNEAKDEFISLASHQLRTPATGVKQYLGMVLDEYAGEVPPAQRRMLDQANLSNERQITIINDLLKVAQVDAGKVILKKQPTDLGRLLREIIDDQRSKFDERGQEVALHVRNGIKPALVDSARLRMVLENLIDNASKYTPEGKRIELQLGRSAGKYTIAISDEGVGIPPEDMDKLFRKFSRLDNPLSITVGGTGLGLYWAKKIVDLHDGDINVSSVPGEGSTFTVVVPA